MCKRSGGKYLGCQIYEGQKLKISKDSALKLVTYERLDGATLGQQVWLVVEYEGEVTSIRAALVEKEPLLGDDGTLPVLAGGSERSAIKLGEPEATNLQGHKKIAKIELRPESDDQLDEWSDNLKNKDGATIHQEPAFCRKVARM